MIRPLMALLLLVAQDPAPKEKKPEDEAARARRAALVDRIMAEVPARKAKAADAEAPAVDVPVAPVPAAPAVPIAPAVPFNQIRMNEFQVQVVVQGKGQVINRTQVRRTLTLEQPAEAREDGEVGEEEEAPAPIRRLNLQTAVVGRENFDRWIFGEGFDEAGRLIRLQTSLTEKINRVMEGREINEAQLRRLRLAGSGDIKRFLDRVEGRRPEFEKARMKYTEGRQFLLKLEPLSEEFRAGPFGDDSIFTKTLRTIDAENRPEGK